MHINLRSIGNYRIQQTTLKKLLHLLMKKMKVLMFYMKKIKKNDEKK